jgi:hypothetical protein
MLLYYISLNYATFGVFTENDIVIAAAPIGQWMIGKNIEYIRKWVENKKGIIKEV